MSTALEYAASFGRRKAELHRLREQDLAALASKDVITVEDIQALEWGVKFNVANQFFDKCDAAAQHALLHDQHHGVRSAAALFNPAARPTPPPPPPQPAASKPAANASVAEVAAAIMNGKKRMATLHGLKSAAGIEEMIASTHPTSLLERAEAFIAGFEGDDLQEGVDQLLVDLRAVLKPIR
jgi:hypothetical protein